MESASLPKRFPRPAGNPSASDPGWGSAHPDSNSMPSPGRWGGHVPLMGGPWLGLQLMRQGYHLDMGYPPLRKPRLRSFRGICPNVPLPAWGRFFGELVTTFYHPPEDKMADIKVPSWFDVKISRKQAATAAKDRPRWQAEWR